MRCTVARPTPVSGEVDVGMEALERTEKPVGIVGVESHAIVLDEEDDPVCLLAEAKLDFGRIAF